MSSLHLLDDSVLAGHQIQDLSHTTAILSAPASGEQEAGVIPGTVYLDHPLPPLAPPVLVDSPGWEQSEFDTIISTRLARCSQVTDAQTALVDPAGAAAYLGTLDSTGQRVLQAVYRMFLALDDHYAEGNDLLAIADAIGLTQETFYRVLERLDWRGYLRLARSVTDRIELAETTFRGMDAYCNVFHEGYAGLLAEVALKVADGMREGEEIRRLIKRHPGLVLAHAVEALAQKGLLHCSHQWSGVCGFQIGQVSPELRVWIEEGRFQGHFPVAA